MRSVRSIPDPGFAGDDGGAAPEVVAALRAYDQDPGSRYGATLAVLQDARLLVPVVALPATAPGDEPESEPEGAGADAAEERTSEMATVLMRGRDGRMALLAFTGTEAMRRWNPAGRPVPTQARNAARAALHDAASALLIDVGGPVKFVVEGDDLHALAEGLRLTPLAGRYGWVRAEPS